VSVSGRQFKARLQPKIAGQDDTIRVSSTSTLADLGWVGRVGRHGVGGRFEGRGHGHTIGSVGGDGPIRAGWTGTNEVDVPSGRACSLQLRTTLSPLARYSPRTGRRVGAERPLEVVEALSPTSSPPRQRLLGDSVQGGPNDGLWYVVAANYYMDRTSEMNPFIRPGAAPHADERHRPARVQARASPGCKRPCSRQFLYIQHHMQGIRLDIHVRWPMEA
jgi:hypothetical protein